MPPVPSLFVRRRKDSDVLEPVRPADAMEIQKLPEGRPFKCRLSKPRNSKVHRLYFAAIAAAAKHWPEGEEPFFDGADNGNADLLRAYLQVKAGYSVKRVFAAEATEELIALVADVRAADRFAFVKRAVVKGEPVAVVFTPMSIRYEELSEVDFSPIKNAVFELIMATLNIPDIMQLVKESENEA